MVTMTVANPSGNQYTITAFSFVTPTGWSVTGCTAGGFLPVCNVGVGGGGVTWTVSTFTVGTGAGIPPGGSDQLAFTATAATAGMSGAPSTYPFTSTFTTKIQDASAVNYYSGQSFSIQVLDPSTAVALAITPGGSNTLASYTAGTAAYSVQATVTCTVTTVCPSGTESGVTLGWTDGGTGATETSYPSSFSSSSQTTGTGGTATVTFQPSEISGATGIPTASIGSSGITCASTGACDSSGAVTITTTNGPPKTMTWAFSASQASTGNHYITTEGTTVNTNTAGKFTGAEQDIGISFAISDAFGNSVPLTSAGLTGAPDGYTFTLTALSGGGLFDTTNLPSVITCTAKAGASTVAWTGSAMACPIAGASVNLPFNYFQDGAYGTIGTLSAAVTGTYSGSSFAGAGQSKLLITSTFAGASPVPTVVASVPSGATLPNVPAGDEVNVTATLGVVQSNVPVQLYLDTANSFETVAGAMDYGANSELPVGFSGSDVASVTTNAAGVASALFTIDTVAGASAVFESNATKITDTMANALTISADSAPAIVTIPNVAATFTVNAYYSTGTHAMPALAGLTTHAATGANLYVDVTISDAYGNTATNTGVNQIQITLTSSCGTSCPLSATSVYIPYLGSDTFASFGAIVWSMPSTTGTVTLTASGVLSGKSKTSAPDSISVVSPNPTLAITSPTPSNGVLYSSTPSVIFTGQANVSIGYASTGSYAVSIASVTYNIDGGAVVSAPISSGYDITFSVAATFTPGLHTISFNATDSLGNTVTGQTYKVLVDTSAPTVAFTTKTGSNFTAGGTVSATITVAEGDLNATSVVATLNGTALASSDVTIAGSNNLGTSVTYTVTISGLTAGTDNVGLSASSLTGLTGTATGITVLVTIPLGESFVVSGTPSEGTLGVYHGINVAYQNLGANSQNVVIFAVWSSASGVLGIGTSSATVAAGASTTAFVVEPVGLASGTYTVNLFVWTTSNAPVSVSTTITATV